MITNERKRINNRCSKASSKVKHNEELEKVLCTNGYPQQFIDDTKVSENSIRNNNNNTDWLYFRMRYISECTIDNKTKSIFKKEGIPLRVTHRSTTLKHILKPLSKPETCIRANCPIADDKVCNLKGVVYKITCIKCHNIYIGSTIRKTHDRPNEHLNTTTSSVYKHVTNCVNTTKEVKVNIIAKDTDNANLRLKEAYYIRRERPKINSKEECSELSDLLF